MTTTILAEFNEHGLYACGSVNFAIAAIMFGLFISMIACVVIGMVRLSLVWVVIGILLFMPGIPIGFFVSAHLAQDSCVGYGYEEGY